MNLLLSLVLLAPPEPIVHPVQTADGIEATLTVTVLERPDRSSLPRAHISIAITGPSTLQVEPARLEDEGRQWKVVRASSWTPEGDRVVTVLTLHLEQRNRGPLPLPGVRIRVRASPEAETQQFEWPDLLGPPPRPLDTGLAPQPVPPSNWPLAVTLSGAMIAGFLALLTWRLTRRPPKPHVATPEEIASAALTGLTSPAAWSDPRTAATRLSTALRTYLTARTGLDLHTRTVRECVDLLRTGPAIPPESLAELEAVLAWCDATRFAGPVADPTTGPTQATQALALLPRLFTSL
jgi:hypothetical protein